MYLDTNLFLHARFDHTIKGDNARKIIGLVAKGHKATTSSFTINEACAVLRKQWPTHLRDAIIDIVEIPNLNITPVSLSSSLRALDYMEMYNLKAADALHAAVMDELGETEIVSDDSDFDRIEHIKRIPLK